MKKLFIITFILLFIVSCVWNFEKWEELEEDPLSSALDINEDNIQLTGWLEQEDSSWNLDETSSWNFEDRTKVLSIEEQYCVSKWWKVVSDNDKNICFITDEIGLLKCEVNVFYQDKCRSKSAVIKDWVVISFAGQEKNITSNISSNNLNQSKLQTEKIEQKDSQKIVETEKNTTLEKITENTSKNKIEEQKYLVEKNLWNWFIFKESETNKHIYLNNTLLITEEKTSRILLDTSENIKGKENLVIFKIFTKGNSTVPSKKIVIDTNTKSIKENTILSEKDNTIQVNNTNTWTLTKENTWTLIKEETSIQTQYWKTGTYYISNWDLKLKTSSWQVKTIFSASSFWSGKVDLYNYELMLNKKIKVFYYVWSDKKQEEEIIDISNF